MFGGSQMMNIPGGSNSKHKGVRVCLVRSVTVRRLWQEGNE